MLGMAKTSATVVTAVAMLRVTVMVSSKRVGRRLGCDSPNQLGKVKAAREASIRVYH